MAVLWDNISIHIADYSRPYILPYSISRGLPYNERILPIKKTRLYVVTKVWNRDNNKAKYCFDLLKRVKTYDKIKLHKNCIYITRRVVGGGHDE